MWTRVYIHTNIHIWEAYLYTNVILGHAVVQCVMTEHQELNCMLASGVKLIGKQACLPGRTPLLLAAGSITYQTKSSALDTQLLPSHQPLQVSTSYPSWNLLLTAVLDAFWVMTSSVYPRQVLSYQR